MKKLNQSIFAIFLLSFLSCIVNAQSAQKRELKFSGTVINTNVKDGYKTIVVDYNSDDGFAPTGHHSSSIKIDSNGHFEFILPDLNKPYKMSLTIYNIDASNAKKLFSYKGYTEPEDDIKMQIILSNGVADSVLFSGNGRVKYQLAKELERQYWKEYYPELNLIKIESVTDLQELNLNMDKLSKLINKYDAKKANLINTAQISTAIKEVLSYEFADYNSEWVWRTNRLFIVAPTYRHQVGENYLKYRDQFVDKPTNLSLLCPIYLINLSSRTIVNLMVLNNSDKIDIKTYYNSIKTQYSENMRDRLLGVFIFSKVPYNNFSSFSNDLRDSLYHDASSIITIPYVKKAVIEKISELAKVDGKEKVFEAEFVDTDGKKFETKSLKGKVFLIDAWFLGCGGCAEFHNAFEKEIYPKFKSNKNFVVLSLNFDGKKDSWLKGLKSKLYTSQDYINVSTGNFEDKNSSQLNHPFMKYYNVKGGPYLMLVDANGFIKYQPSNGTSVAEMTDKISEALASK
jgi:cytochrome oxidase Cu insertion factor (SCO1/SenC/PrrC family)